MATRMTHEEAAAIILKERWTCGWPRDHDGWVVKSMDRLVHEMVTKARQTIKTHTGCSTYEGTKLYFFDKKSTENQVFAVLDVVGQKRLDLVFFASATDALPENTRRVKLHALIRDSECRLRLDQTNLRDVGKIAAKSRDYIRSLNETGK